MKFLKKWIMAGLVIILLIVFFKFSDTKNITFENRNFKVNNITLPKNPFFISSPEKINPYNGVGSINLNKIIVPNSNLASASVFFNVSVTSDSSVCYTSKWSYFLSKNVFPDLRNVDSHDDNQTVFPV